MSKRLAQIIASLFLILSAAMLYALLSEPRPKEPYAFLILGLLDGLIAFIGVLIFVWVAQRKQF
jgi:hypothetical protein